ncbi:hypothetical protein [Pseudomonas sp. NPDC089569]|uniref:hypothetical protein n=1 Tax=Pseudomonas sp. NPDC089569 TaxID=3390722 RepID=UPI003D03C6E4
MTKPLFGDAVLSSRILRKASQGIEGTSNLAYILSLFSLIEAAVLYEQLWYVPIGDANGNFAEKFCMWDFLHSAGVLKLYEADDWKESSALSQTVNHEWQQKILDISTVPTYAHAGQQQVLSTAFYYAFAHPAWAESVYDNPEDNQEFFTPGQLRDWQRFASGSDFDQAVEDANDGEDGGRYTTWENMAKIMARATMIDALGADYVGDAIESPIILMANSIAHKNTAARLYEVLSENLERKIKELIDDGYNCSLAIPPIVALVLDRSDGNYASICSEILSLREEFSAFRARYRAYQDTLKNPADRTLNELAGLKRSQMEEVTAALNKIAAKRTDSTILTEIFGAEISTGSQAGNSLEFSPKLSINELLKLATNELHLANIKGRASVLFDTYEKVKNIRQYHKLLQKRLGVSIAREQVDNYGKYASIVESISNVARH